MSDVTRILSQIESGDPSSAEQLLPLVYDELRKLAAAKLAQEKPGQTLQATALVHEAYLRLVDARAGSSAGTAEGTSSPAAAEAMRRILVETARRKQSANTEDAYRRSAWAMSPEEIQADDTENLLALDEALALLEAEDRPRHSW